MTLPTMREPVGSSSTAAFSSSFAFSRMRGFRSAAAFLRMNLKIASWEDHYEKLKSNC